MRRQAAAAADPVAHDPGHPLCRDRRTVPARFFVLPRSVLCSRSTRPLHPAVRLPGSIPRDTLPHERLDPLLARQPAGDHRSDSDHRHRRAGGVGQSRSRRTSSSLVYKSPRGAGADVLRRDVGDQRREEPQLAHGTPAIPGQAAGTQRQESRSIVGASIIRNYYADDIDPSSSALTPGSTSLATVEIPTLPPGTLPPVILPYDPTSSTPVALVALNSKTQNESALFDDTARYQVRMMISGPRRERTRRSSTAARARDHPWLTWIATSSAGPRPVSGGCDAGARPVQRLHPGRGREIRPVRLRARLERDVRAGRQDGRHPDPVRPGTAARSSSEGRGDADGRGGDPDERRPGGRPPPGVHPRLPTARGEHSERGEQPAEEPAGYERPAHHSGRGPEAGDGPVGVRPQRDREPRRRGGSGGRPLFARDPGLPGRVADDFDRRSDHPGRRARHHRLPLWGRPDDQRDDAGRLGVGDRPARRYGDRGAGKHASPPRTRCEACRSGIPRREGGRSAGHGSQPLHASGPSPPYPHARSGGLPVPPAVLRRGLRHGHCLFPFPNVRPGPLRGLAAGTRAQADRVPHDRLRAPQRTRERPAQESARPAVRAVGGAPRRRDPAATLRLLGRCDPDARAR